jgi:hypothetical protein
MATLEFAAMLPLAASHPSTGPRSFAAAPQSAPAAQRAGAAAQPCGALAVHPRDGVRSL